MKKNLFLFGVLCLLGLLLGPFFETFYQRKSSENSHPSQITDVQNIQKPVFVPVKWIPLPDLSGRMHEIKENAGRVVLVNFWASWCAPCLVEIPSMLALAEQNQEKLDIVFVSTDSSEDQAKKMMEKIAPSPPANVSFLHDPSWRLAHLYSVEKLPETLWIAPDLTIRSKTVGPAEWVDSATQERIDTLFEESSFNTPTP